MICESSGKWCEKNRLNAIFLCHSTLQVESDDDDTIMVKCVCVNIVSFTLLLCMLAVTGRTVRGMMVASTTSTSAARAATTKRHRNTIVFHWFRHGDLRLDDNPALVHSSQLAAAAAVHGDAHVVPIFCFDDQKFFGSAVATPSQSWKCGPRRAKFIVESVSDLRAQLQASNSRSQLLVARGDPATIFDKLLTQLTKTKVDDVSIVCQEEVVQEERDAVQSVAAILKKHYPCRSATTATTTTTSSKVHCIWGSTMYDLKDLPYAAGLTDMPDVFTPFRTKVEQKSAIAKPLPVPNKLPFPPATSIEYQSIFIDHMTYMPTLQDLGYTDDDIRMAEDMDPRGVMTFEGGATSGLRRVKEYIWDRDLLRNYFDTRNGMIGPDYSTKFSPWLAHGCLSPRRIVQECQRYERERVANKSTYWVIFELLWRDYCKFFAVKHGNAIFFPGGTTGRDKKWQEGAATAKTLEAWKEGRTGFPLVDANMREMKATGFMSNRGRQNVASFLAIDLAQDWRRGGDWFESQLIDYDVYSNWVVSSS